MDSFDILTPKWRVPPLTLGTTALSVILSAGAGEVEEKDVFTEVDDHFRPRCYDKTKSFFDNFSSDNKFR